jgi:NAD(P)-dependent dehydrogenase (short-subunit alcohol dehydrogenase family)
VEEENSVQQGIELQNKRVIILGGSSGIGLAVAAQASSQGADVVIVSSNPERVQEATKSIVRGVDGYAVDLPDEQAVAERVNEFETSGMKV